MKGVNNMTMTAKYKAIVMPSVVDTKAKDVYLLKITGQRAIKVEVDKLGRIFKEAEIETLLHGDAVYKNNKICILIKSELLW
jgi:hypothetical protein